MGKWMERGREGEEAETDVYLVDFLFVWQKTGRANPPGLHEAAVRSGRPCWLLLLWEVWERNWRCCKVEMGAGLGWEEPVCRQTRNGWPMTTKILSVAATRCCLQKESRNKVFKVSCRVGCFL